MKKTFGTIILAAVIASCSTTPALIPSPSPITTPIPTATISTSTVAPIPSFTPTATESPNVLEEQAAVLCEKAYSAQVQPQKAEAPVLGMYKTETRDDANWAVTYAIPHLFALSKESVRSVVCSLETRKQAGIYTDGSAGFRLTMHIRILSWPEGIVVASKIFESGDPPKTRTGFGAAYGSYPNGMIRAWMLSQFDGYQNSDFLFWEDGLISSALAVSPDEHSMAFAVSDPDTASNKPSKITLIDPQTLQSQLTWVVPTSKINSLIYSPDGTYILSAGFDSKITFWDSQTGLEQNNIALPSSAYTIKYSPDGKFLAAASTNKLYLIDTLSNEILNSYPVSSTTFSFSPDGKIVYTDTESLNTMTGDVIRRYYDYAQWIPTVSLEGDVSFDTGLPDSIHEFDLAPDGTYGVSYSFSGG